MSQNYILRVQFSATFFLHWKELMGRKGFARVPAHWVLGSRQQHSAALLGRWKVLVREIYSRGWSGGEDLNITLFACQLFSLSLLQLSVFILIFLVSSNTAIPG